MMQLTRYHLAFRSGFHLGTRGVNLEERAVCLPSDTLFAALVDALRRMGANPDAFVAPFPRKDAPKAALPPFTLSSAFPRAGRLCFFPMPVGLKRLFSADTLMARNKEIKRIRFLSEGLFRRMLGGEHLDDWLFPEDARADPQKGVAVQAGRLWMAREEQERLPTTLQKDSQTGRPIPARALRHRKVYALERVPRVTVERISSASQIFHAGRVVFAPGCGLWFGVDWRRPSEAVEDSGWSYQDAFNRVLAVLEDEGIGGERSSGYGAFSLEQGQDTLDLEGPVSGGLVLLLSRYHPRPEELPRALCDAACAYQLFPVGGWLRSWDGAAQRRKRLWFVAEGSVVRAVDDAPWGDVVDVRPTFHDPLGDLPHPVWRYGLALGAALKEVDRG